MTSTDLTPAQATQLRQLIARELRLLNRVCQRMEMLGFPPADPLYRATLNARHHMQALHVEAHYCSCTTGIGRAK